MCTSVKYRLDYMIVLEHYIKSDKIIQITQSVANLG
jgi:hypothetical protein